jgi:hypothetical protein
MGCCGFHASGATLSAPDPCKRVNYTLGMLLGVDDFVQESAYNNERRHEIAREVLGYGTVHGLQLVVEPDGDKGPRVRVEPGMAWMPSGKPVCVDGSRCAHLNEWLTANASKLTGKTVGDELARPSAVLHVVLAHAECLTDNVPIPGEPCRDESELMQPSRVTDSYCLSLRLDAPPQREEDAIRDFVSWLMRSPFADSSPPLSDEDFVARVREAAQDWLAGSSPLSPPADYMLGTAPEGTNELLLQTAIRLWTTELRPRWMARAGCGCSAAPIAAVDDAVLLATLNVPLVALGDGSYRVDDGDRSVEQDESRRPVLLTLRMVQELVTHAPSPDPSDFVSEEVDFGLLPQAGFSNDYARADHTHGSPQLPDLGGDLSGPLEEARVESLQGVPLLGASPLVDGHVLTLEDGAWVPRAPQPSDDNAAVVGGDLQGPLEDAQVRSIQAIPVNYDVALETGLVLTVENETWVPRSPQISLYGDVTNEGGAVTVTAIQGIGVSSGDVTEGQVLRYSGGNWLATRGYVDRGELNYEIVAAGQIRLVLEPRPDLDAPPQLVAYTENPYNDLSAGELVLQFNNDRPYASIALHARVREFKPSNDRFGVAYIVKLTPVWNEKSFGIQAYLRGAVKASRDGSELDFNVVVAGSDQDALPNSGFQVEVSRYETYQRGPDA